jgi:diguanylate cyclase (GGDEF)-like protein
LKTQTRGGELRGISIFVDLTDEDLKEVRRNMHQRTVRKGDTLFGEGDPGDELFVILKGAVAVTVRTQAGEEVALSEIGAGNFLGEMSIVEQATRSATCRAVQNCELLTLHADDFLTLIVSRPAAASAILRRMAAITAARLGTTGSLLSQMVKWGEGSRKRALTDEATGLFNRRFYDESFADIMRRTNLEGRPLALAMFDLDRFGSLNKEYGQVFGDRLIVEAAAVFRRAFGETDILVRYGGDEFAFILPGRDEDAAVARCAAVNEGIRALRFAEHPDLRLTCSLGVAVHPRHALTLEELKDRADKALYRAKELGRDRTETAAS